MKINSIIYIYIYYKLIVILIYLFQLLLNEIISHVFVIFNSNLQWLKFVQLECIYKIICFPSKLNSLFLNRPLDIPYLSTKLDYTIHVDVRN